MRRVCLEGTRHSLLPRSHLLEDQGAIPHLHPEFLIFLGTARSHNSILLSAGRSTNHTLRMASCHEQARQLRIWPSDEFCLHPLMVGCSQFKLCWVFFSESSSWSLRLHCCVQILWINLALLPDWSEWKFFHVRPEWKLISSLLAISTWQYNGMLCK